VTESLLGLDFKLQVGDSSLRHFGLNASEYLSFLKDELLHCDGIGRVELKNSSIELTDLDIVGE
jgi:hypothetical protein